MKNNEKELQEEVLEISEPSEIKEEPVAPVEPVRYIHVDEFLQTAVPLFGLNRMQARGFKTLMFGRLYQTSMEAFVEELEKYLGKKLR
jgi:hypothetical protein